MFIARVAYNLFSWHVPPSSCFHGVCRLKVSGISSFRRFQTSFYNVLCPHFLFSSRVSLLGFLSLYSAYPFQAGLFMEFLACSRLSDSGENAKVKGTRKVGGKKKRKRKGERASAAPALPSFPPFNFNFNFIS